LIHAKSAQNRLHGVKQIKLMDDSGVELLSNRQKECLRLVAKGYESKDIAVILKIEHTTVNNHISVALQRLRVSRRVDAAQILLRSEADEHFTSEPQALVPDAQPDIVDASPAAKPWWRNFNLPGLVGETKGLSWRQICLQILSVAILSATIVAALTLLLAGAMMVLS